MSQHTPGKWIAKHLDDTSIITQVDWEKGYEIAHLSTWGDESRKKDAELIAAAPDLLAACKRAVEELGAMSDSEDFDLIEFPFTNITLQLRNVIAKAEGRA